MEANKNKEIMN